MNQLFSWDELWKEAPNRYAHLGPSLRHKLRRLSSLVATLPDISSCLDVCCGDGTWLRMLQDKFRFETLWGCDLSSVALEMAAQNCPSATFLRCDVQQPDAITHFNRLFDLVTCTNALEEIPDDDAALRLMYRVVRPGGYCLIVVPHRQGYWTYWDDYAKNLRRYEVNELTAKMQHAGFGFVQTSSWGFPLYTVYYWLLTRQHGGGNLVMNPQIGPVKRFVMWALYIALFMDDLFAGNPRGRILFAVGQK